jgi:hypothetical protein
MPIGILKTKNALGRNPKGAQKQNKVLKRGTTLFMRRFRIAP